MPPCRTELRNAGDSGQSTRAAAGGPPPSPARAGERLCPPARTVQATGDSDCGTSPSDPPPHQPGPGTGSATPPGRCPATRAARPQVTRIGQTARSHGRQLTVGANGRGPRRDLATLQSTGRPALLGGRWVRCKGHTPTYFLYTAGGRQPRVYTACHNSTKMQMACLFV